MQAAKKLSQAKAEKSAKANATQPADADSSSVELFAKAKLAVGIVTQVEEVANSDKLYK